MLIVIFVALLKEHLVEHARWEDRVLYPLVDEKAGTGGANRFTATMRHEHEIVARWIAELEREANASRPDIEAFTRRAHQLLGLVVGHFEAEEQVLLPVIARTMTKAEFEARTKHRE